MRDYSSRGWQYWPERNEDNTERAEYYLVTCKKCKNRFILRLELQKPIS